LLTLHILAFIAAMGTTLLRAFSFHQLWKLYAIGDSQSMAAFQWFLKTSTVGMIGLFVAILAGLSMEFTVSFAHAQFTWFRIKMFLVVLLFINGFTQGRISTLRLQKLFAEKSAEPPPIKVTKLKRACDLFIYSQLTIFLLIIIMVAFRFV
jgi:hypothetical protein